MGQAHTIQQLLSNPESFELGFDLAQKVFEDSAVQEHLYFWYKCARQALEKYKENITKGVPMQDGWRHKLAAAVRILPRVERYLEVMEIINSDGERIIDTGDAIALGGHCGTRVRVVDPSANGGAGFQGSGRSGAVLDGLDSLLRGYQTSPLGQWGAASNTRRHP